MRIGRFVSDNRTFFGIVEGENVMPIKEKRVSELMESATPTGESIPIRNLKFLSPTKVSKIVAVGLNYKAHARELGMDTVDEPMIFLKPSTSVIANRMRIYMPTVSKRVDYEAELAVVIGKRCKNVGIDEAKNVILGYSCFNDVTARDIQRKNDFELTKSKSFDSFAPYGPWITTDLDPSGLNITTRVNGEVKQNGNTSDMIFSPFELVSLISKVMTLLPGDIISTGTPPGIGPLNHRDKVEVEIEGIGKLVNYAVREGE